jgi:hypothetical protein
MLINNFKDFSMNLTSTSATYHRIKILEAGNLLFCGIGEAQQVNNVYFERRFVGRSFFAPLFSLKIVPLIISSSMSDLISYDAFCSVLVPSLLARVHFSFIFDWF